MNHFGRNSVHVLVIMTMLTLFQANNSSKLVDYNLTE